MKDNGLLKFFGNCVIAASILAAGCVLAFNLPDTTYVPSSLRGDTQSEQVQFGDYLSRYEAAAYLEISSDERLIESGAGGFDYPA